MGRADGVYKGPAGGGVARGGAGIDQAMLRFRPIAPKPAAEDPGQGGSHVGSKGWLLSGARTKRKYVRVRKAKAKANSNCSGNNNHDSSTTTKRKRAAQGPKEKGGPDDSSGLEKRIVTLQLLPEKADHGESTALKAKPEQSEKEEPQWRSSIDRCSTYSGPEFSTVNLAIPNVVPPLSSRSDPIDLIRPTFQSPHRMRYPTVLECWVIVESVAGTHIDAQDHHQLAGLTDAERVRSLKADACPGFLADPSNRVKWVNGAFERMVMREHLADHGADGGPLPAEIAVRVESKEELPKTRAAFACRATLRRRQHPWWGEEKWAARIVPCDVWRMDEMGGFAWRLDVKAALSLGLS